MKKLTLSQMNPAQARDHYDVLVYKRITRGLDIWKHAELAPKPIRKEMVREARAKCDKALAWSMPQSWHIDRATKLRETYGIGVAAAFLAAHGWSFDAAHNVLF